MNKIDTISAAFSIAYTREELEKQKKIIESRLDEMSVLEGPTGPRGPQGARGEQGLKGDKGVKGDKGEKGDTGPQGEQGIQGESGDIGPKGERGETGPQGLQGLQGVKGEKGDKGDQGEVGPAGPQGEKGDQGIQGPIGPTGGVGAQGAKGDKGDKGDTGPRGERGEQGPRGEVGSQGPKGDRGEKGEQGEAGKDAPDYEPRFEELLKEFNKKVSDQQTTVNKNVDRQLNNLQKSLSSLGGGGSYKLVDNADVDKSALKGVVDNAVLIYDPTKKKFIAEDFISIINRLKAELEVQYNKLIDYVDADNYYYIGEALPGTGESEAKWRIKRIEEVGDDYNILWAEGNADFDKIWDDRTTFTYS